MQLTSSAITINLNQNTTYSSVTGLWTLGNGHAYHNGVINNGYYFSGFMEKSNSNLSIPEGASTENIYFLFQDGNDIGLAISLENASAKTPIVFATAGDFFYFKQTGKTYNLNPINNICCEPDYFETQYPEESTYSAALDGGTYSGKSRFPIPCYLPKKISFTWGTIGNIDLYLIYYSPNPTSDYYSTYRPFLIYGNGQDNHYYGSTDRFSAKLQYYHDKLNDTIRIRLHIITWVLVNGNVVYTNNIYVINKPLTYDANNNIDDDFFETIPDLERFYPNDSPATLSLTTDGNYVEDLLPETITLTKINSPVTINDVAFTPTVLRINGGLDPEHGWTVNDYDDELPETITLNKVSVTNYESESFVTSVNVTNKIKLKLANSHHFIFGYSQYGYFGYLFFIHKDDGAAYTGFYLPGYFKWKFEPLPEDVNAIRYSMPSKVSYGPVQFRLFKMAGIPAPGEAAPLSGRCFADVFYMVVDPSE